MPHQPRITVILPAYNAVKWIRGAIDSVFAQNWENIELIAVNDGSTDQTAEILRSISHPSFRVLSLDRGGVARARNIALEGASGEYIQYLDADDLLGAGKLAAQVQELQHRPGAIASCRWAKFVQNPQEGTFVPDLLWIDLQPLEWLLRHAETGSYMPPHCWLTPRGIHDAAGRWNEELVTGNDAEFFCRVLLRARAVKFCPGAEVYYRMQVIGSLTHRGDPEAMMSLIRSSRLWCSWLMAAGPEPRTRHACIKFLRRIFDRVQYYTPELSELVAQELMKLNSGEVPIEGSLAFKTLTGIVGWTRAKRLQHSYRKLRERIGLLEPPI